MVWSTNGAQTIGLVTTTVVEPQRPYAEGDGEKYVVRGGSWFTESDSTRAEPDPLPLETNEVMDWGFAWSRSPEPMNGGGFKVPLLQSLTNHKDGLEGVHQGLGVQAFALVQ